MICFEATPNGVVIAIGDKPSSSAEDYAAQLLRLARMSRTMAHGGAVDESMREPPPVEFIRVDGKTHGHVMITVDLALDLDTVSVDMSPSSAIHLAETLLLAALEAQTTIEDVKPDGPV